MSRSRVKQPDIGQRFLMLMIGLPSFVIALHLMLVFIGPSFR